MMNNKRLKGWVKGVLAFVNVVSLTGWIIVMLLSSFINEMGTKEYALNYGYSRIMKHYVASFVQEVSAGNDEYTVLKYYNNKNIKMAFAAIPAGYKRENEIWVYEECNVALFTDTILKTDNCEWGETLTYKFYMPKDGDIYGVNLSNVYTAVTGEVGYTNTYVPEMYYYVAYEQADEIQKGDLMYEWQQFVNGTFSKEEFIILACNILPVIFLITAIVLALVTGENCKTKKSKLNIVDVIPLELLTILVIAMEVVLYRTIGWMLYNGWGDVISILFILIMSTLPLIFMLSLVRRIKAKKIFKYTLLYYITKPLQSIKGEIIENTPLVTKVVVSLSLITIFELIALVCTDGNLIYVLVCFIIYKIFEYVFVLYVAFQMWILKDGVKKIADGDINSKIATNKLSSDFKKHGENINRIGDGIAVAVNEQMKSERMKTELITNVSHDIKTPLTSIINYVDLLKKEDIKNETANEYVEVLERQSARLKKLIEDLMEASKASTGNIEVNLEECDVKVILSQALGEFSEKLDKTGLEVVVTQTDDEATVMVDGRHLWRVFDNLINNICKYSMSGTRVYINIEKNEKGVKVSFKNVSKEQLNISSDELMERFVRGDGSRNTEGSGLGLSIARSLTELMGGTMEVLIDGDLFKVVLKL